MAEYINRARVLKYINDIQLTVSDPKKPTIIPRELCEWIFDGISTLPTIEVSTDGIPTEITIKTGQTYGKSANMLKDLEIETVTTSKTETVDLIYRQAAIEALTGWETEPLDEDIVRTLKSLPTVTPSRNGNCGTFQTPSWLTEATHEKDKPIIERMVADMKGEA